jgi:hypothetical protein
MRNALITIGTAALVALVLCWALSCEGTARAEDAPCDAVCMTARAIQTLQPAVTAERAARLAGVFVAAGEETDLDPLLLVAIARRESSFFLSVEELTKLGTARQERGLMQAHGVALDFRPEGCARTLEGAECQVRTGARYLAHCRETCPGSTWRWVAYYGTGVCRSEAESRRDRNANIAASFYSQISGERW